MPRLSLVVANSHCGVWASHCDGFSCCELQVLGHTGTVLVVHGLSCPTACGILLPAPGIEPMSPALSGGFLTTQPPGKSHPLIFLRRKSRMQKWCSLSRACSPVHSAMPTTFLQPCEMSLTGQVGWWVLSYIENMIWEKQLRRTRRGRREMKRLSTLHYFYNFLWVYNYFKIRS